MAEWLPVQQLPKAPIVEAVIDVKVGAPRGSQAALSSVRVALSSKYPVSRDIRLLGSQVEVGPTGHRTSVSEKVIGIRCENTDKNEIVQARIDGVAYSRLTPYLDWHEFSARAREAWNQYRQVIEPERVMRVAVRYINRVAPNASSAEIREQLLTKPNVGGDLGAEPDWFISRLEVPTAEDGVRAIVAQALQPEAGGLASLTIDIDVFVRWPNQDFSDDEIWDRLDVLRSVKNRIFFGCFRDTPTVRAWFGL